MGVIADLGLLPRRSRDLAFLLRSLLFIVIVVVTVAVVTIVVVIIFVVLAFLTLAA
jgi:hypothetical protein